jgi:hypothetical protein
MIREWARRDSNAYSVLRESTEIEGIDSMRERTSSDAWSLLPLLIAETDRADHPRMGRAIHL